ncbi:MAG: hemolysin III family protein [Leptotrichiaceae bacterium]|jgi:hemolysin III|nr:hemolysin III family protein [Leptotrichiaceae bacterium]MBP6168097.1 hemolysin III family protein [Leptotrichiaceae bacterium]MBP7026249.1 hemolysin III family protein [Leptotrichiaceae bacterium]MBP8636739.1 hemolysin III family protein [Leptotrichiaceae bacterium]MBP9539309.1 hemolysin III family protein [Leptotrichiaceae bacterium]
MKIINTFSKDEEIANAVSHMVGATLALISAVVLIMHGIKTKSPIVITSFAIFGAGLVIMYTVSSIYHALHNNKAKQVFQILDHSAIYILIAASYTPFLLLVVKSKAGYIIFFIQWLICIFGIAFKSLCVEKYVLFSTLLYIVMGWMIMFVWGDLIANISQQSLILLFIGGILYTLGTIFYMWNWFKYHHFIWHIFVLLGSVAHFFAVYLLV